MDLAMYAGNVNFAEQGDMKRRNLRLKANTVKAIQQVIHCSVRNPRGSTARKFVLVLVVSSNRMQKMVRFMNTGQLSDVSLLMQ
jgi:uncharacterized BrkB/YihY/UPF0761 family membrane protein